MEVARLQRQRHCTLSINQLLEVVMLIQVSDELTFACCYTDHITSPFRVYLRPWKQCQFLYYRFDSCRRGYCLILIHDVFLSRTTTL